MSNENPKTEKTPKTSAEKPQETSAEKFRRIANFRVGKLDNVFRQLNNLGRYDHTEEEAEKILSHIVEKVEVLKNALAQKAKAEKGEVSLFE